MVTTEELASHDELTLGDVVDERFELESILGEGGYGIVYRAVQKSTGQFVALKVLRADRIKAEEDGSEIARFEREMKLIGKLNHPNVVRLVDFGTLGDGRLFTVIEYIEGVNLADLMETEGALRPSEAKYLMTQVLEALGAAHELGIVYRDLKPQNIMVTTGGLRRGVKLLDFGISGLMEDARDEDYQHLTQDGKINGTPSYMAPEQLRAEALTCATDVYAWGLVFLEMLLGYQAVSDDSYVEVLAKQISPNPVEIPLELEQQALGHILRKAVEKDLDNRYKSVEEALIDLEDCLVPTQMVLPWTGTLARRNIEESISIRRQRGRTPSGMVSSSTWSDSMQMSRPVTMSGQFTGTVEQPKSSKAVIALLLVLLLIVGVGVGVLLKPAAPEASAVPATPAGAATPAVAAAPAEPAEPAPVADVKKEAEPTSAKPAAPEMLDISVQVSPSSAEIYVDGKKRAVGGITFQLEKDAKDHTLEVKADGYESKTVTFNNVAPPAEIKLSKKSAPTRNRNNWRRPVKVAAKVVPPPAPEPVVEKPEPAPKPTPKAKAKPKKWEVEQSDLDNPWGK